MAAPVPAAEAVVSSFPIDRHSEASAVSRSCSGGSVHPTSSCGDLMSYRAGREGAGEACLLVSPASPVVLGCEGGLLN